MNTHLKSVLSGIAMGLTPLMACALLYWVASPFIEKNSEASFSSVLMGCYALSSFAVFVMAMVMIMVKNKPIMGGVALFLMIFQLIIGVSFITGI